MNERRKFRLFEHAKKPSRRVLVIFGIIVGLLTLATAPEAAVSTYQHAITDGAKWQLAFGKAAITFGAVTLLWLLHGGLYLFIGCVWLPRIVHDFREIGTGVAKGVRGIPSAARSTWKWLGDAKRTVASGLGRLVSGSTSLPGKWRAMTGTERYAAIFATLSIAMLFGIGYLNWGLAGSIHAWLPTWMQTDDIFGRLYIDVIMSMFMWAFVMPFWSLLGSFIGKRLFKSSNDKNR